MRYQIRIALVIGIGLELELELGLGFELVLSVGLELDYRSASSGKRIGVWTCYKVVLLKGCSGSGPSLTRSVSAQSTP
jgi:hypothetical protein